MSDPVSPAERVDAALARIEAAAAVQLGAADALARRHAALRERIAEAVGALDELLPAGDR